jgi:CDP-diglyceride synthetase
MGQVCQAILWMSILAISHVDISLLTRYGRFWAFFPMQCIGFNDTFAFVAGKLFGKHKLIKVSPSKTVEGFIGGMLCNIVQTWYFSGYMLQSATKAFWICGSKIYDIGIFKNYTCEEFHDVFKLQQVSILGWQIECLPA